MSHSSTAPLHTPPPMKKKVVAAILAVIIGHVGVLWAVSQMKAPELPQIKKEPLKVKFVKIKEPPPPKELPKPKEPPKPKQVKIVEKELPPPKKVEKVVEVKKAETKKVVEKTVKAESAPVVSTTVTTKITTQAKPDPEPAPKNEPAVEPVQSSPKSVSIGGAGVQWSRSPKLSFKSSEITASCRVVISIKANEKGSVTTASVKNSSCSPELTSKVANSVRNAKFKPYKENGVAYPISAEQPFDLTPTTK